MNEYKDNNEILLKIIETNSNLDEYLDLAPGVKPEALDTDVSQPPSE